MTPIARTLRRVGWSAAAGAVFLVCAPAGEATAQLRRNVKLTPGMILVATRGLPDPNFAQAVVLLAEYSAEGAMGLVLNRRTDIPIARAFTHLKPPHERALIYAGGPVAPSRAVALCRSTSSGGDTRIVVPGVEIIGARAPLEDLIRRGESDDRFRVFLGHAGWSPGQLDREVVYGAWHVLSGEAAVLFDADPDSLWARQIKRTEERLARLLFASPSI
jgi:putative transcriptional regulator